MEYVHEIDTLIQEVSLAIGKPISRGNAKSILSDSGMSGLNIDPSNIKDWIKTNCRRIDVIINADIGVFALDLIEGIMHYKYEPKYEGFASQR
ncbi:hypothetical protein [Paenibacillus sp. SN-8-1]|uniref:hypothetical protein n=1 Tax=Paenibacillus sp. SN-8-1 TaxID=3435409 RepID=UPI003D9A110C